MPFLFSAFRSLLSSAAAADTKATRKADSRKRGKIQNISVFYGHYSDTDTEQMMKIIKKLKAKATAMALQTYFANLAKSNPFYKFQMWVNVPNNANS